MICKTIGDTSARTENALNGFRLNKIKRVSILFLHEKKHTFSETQLISK